MRKTINGIFLGLISVVILGSLFKALFVPTDINEYENRYSVKLEAPMAETYLSGEFQDNTEAALADQVLFAIPAKQAYNKVSSSINKSILDKVLAYAEEKSKNEANEEESQSPQRAIADPNAKYIQLPSGLLMLKDHLMYNTRFLDVEKPRLDPRIANINETIAAFPDIDFYIYYIEKETDINFVSGERSNVFEYLFENIDLPESQKNRFAITNFEDYDSWFYKTDHHLNHRGALECYKQFLAWMLPEETPLSPTGEYEIGYYSGSKAVGSDEGYQDINSCYSYDYVKVDTWENGNKVNYYGKQDSYINQSRSRSELFPSVSYGDLFGYDDGEVRFENPEKEGDSILFIGDSMDNTLLRLLAGHFPKLYDVDLRNYEAKMGEEFTLESYLAKHPDIKKVMLIGTLDIFNSDQFELH